MDSNECFICGCNNYTVQDGAFVCNECGIQSQTIREEQIIFNENLNKNYDDNIDTNYEITAGSQLEKPKKLLSWECFNLILKGLTNEIIELGAKPSLKVIVLQLWVRYLQHIEAAFISKKFKKLPKLDTTINNIDGNILYGVENLKKKILHAKTGIITGKKIIKRRSIKRKSSNNSSATSFMTASQKRYKINRKLAKMNNPTNNSNNDSVGLSDDVSLLQRSNKSYKIKIKLRKKMKKSLMSMPTKTEDLTIEESSKLLKSGKKYWKNLKSKEQNTILNIKKLISIIRLALMINDDNIYLSDILRWIHEGHFHVNRANLFLPENVLHGITISPMTHNSSRYQLNLDLAMLLDCLEAYELPNIDFKKLVIRFCDELQLPNDFTHFVCKLILISPPNIKYGRVLPDYEVKVMAYILFAAKFLFCLDGVAENLSSHFAEKINRLNNTNEKLFNWNDYVQYIECRNSVTSEFNYLLHKELNRNNIRNTQLFINDWDMMKSTLPTLEKDKLSKAFRDNTEFLFKSLPNIGKKGSYREIPASLKPLSSTLNWILEYHSIHLSDEAKKILQHNFTQTDILYLTDEARIRNLAEECNVSIEINYNTPLHYMQQTNKNSETKVRNGRTCTVTAKTKVHIIDQDQPIIKNNNNENKHHTTLNNLNNEKPNTIFLGTGQNYWFVHVNKMFLNTSNAKINRVFNKQLPSSFLWFMYQCCRTLDCQKSDLYGELMNIENEFSTLLQTKESSTQTDCEDMLSNITL